MRGCLQDSEFVGQGFGELRQQLQQRRLFRLGERALVEVIGVLAQLRRKLVQKCHARVGERQVDAPAVLDVGHAAHPALVDQFVTDARHVAARGGYDRAILGFFVACGVSRLARYNVTAESMSDETGKVKLSVAITYTPTGGEPSSQSVKVKLKKTL